MLFPFRLRSIVLHSVSFAALMSTSLLPQRLLSSLNSKDASGLTHSEISNGDMDSDNLKESMRDSSDEEDHVSENTRYSSFVSIDAIYIEPHIPDISSKPISDTKEYKGPNTELQSLVCEGIGPESSRASCSLAVPRMLNDDKRREIWQNYKKAEECLLHSISVHNMETPNCNLSRLDTLLAYVKCFEGRDGVDTRLEGLLCMLRSELLMMRHESRSAPSQTRNTILNLELENERLKQELSQRPSCIALPVSCNAFTDQLISYVHGRRRSNVRRRCFIIWKLETRKTENRRSQRNEKMKHIFDRNRLQSLALSFRKLQYMAVGARFELKENNWHQRVCEARAYASALSSTFGAKQLISIWNRSNRRKLHRAFSKLDRRRHQQNLKRVFCCKLLSLQRTARKADLLRAIHRLQANAQLAIMPQRHEMAEMEKQLQEAKECVFVLTKSNWKAQVQSNEIEKRHYQNEITALRASLRFQKHVFVAQVLGRCELSSLRVIWIAWGRFTAASLAQKSKQKQLDLYVQSAAMHEQSYLHLKQETQERNAQIEMLQTSLGDKTLAADIVAKKLLHSAQIISEMEESHNLLEERYECLELKWKSILRWKDLCVSEAFVNLSRDVCISNLYEFFLRHSDKEAAVPRISFTSMLSILQVSSFMQLKSLSTEILQEKLRFCLSAPGLTEGISFSEYLSAIQKLANNVFADSQTRDSKVTEFYASLLNLATSFSMQHGQRRRQTIYMGIDKGSWVNGLSNEIIQNQERFLAILEHETAVVERAVMEKSSLKHAYPTNDSRGRVASPEDEPFPDWQREPQVHDLFLTFRDPLTKLWNKYAPSGECTKEKVIQMLTDLGLFPAYIPIEFLSDTFASLCGSSDALTERSYKLLLSSCGLYIYEHSEHKPAPFQLSTRDVLCNFFCDLGFLAQVEQNNLCILGRPVESILWPLFEYYASLSSEKLCLSEKAFITFLNDIDGQASCPKLPYSELFRQSATLLMGFDQFCIAISTLQRHRMPDSVYESIGDAVRAYMQQIK